MFRQLLISAIILTAHPVARGEATPRVRLSREEVAATSAYRLALDASRRQLNPAELLTVANDTRAAFVYLEGALKHATRGIGRNHPPLPPSVDLAPLNAAMRALWSALDEKKDVRWESDFCTRYRQFGYWAYVVAFDGTASDVIRDICLPSDYHVENCLVSLYYHRVAHEPRTQRARVDYWLRLGLASRADATVAVVRFAELPRRDGRLAIDDLFAMTKKSPADDILPLMVPLMTVTKDRRIAEIPASYVESASPAVRFGVKYGRARFGISPFVYSRAVSFHSWTGSEGGVAGIHRRIP